ncbi:hypothetical protein DPMN_001784 [Dreissena polymorpha]|uniref:Uncharacterized protein n=1 Tax=Dreissena polymorpha TaxID=45954 RepID=A0A9D4RR56_DREPO|nr:hypothetical protein DPMN_001784 [Dreissena polymorpha]
MRETLLANKSPLTLNVADFRLTLCLWGEGALEAYEDGPEHRLLLTARREHFLYLFMVARVCVVIDALTNQLNLQEK